jgi:uracil-DNA glycosylase
MKKNMIKNTNGSVNGSRSVNRTRALINKIPKCYHEFFLKHKDELRSIMRKVRGNGTNKPIFYPEEKYIFRSLIDLKDAKFMIIGQDPYHNGSAEGYSFSVSSNSGNSINASLRNIFSEIEKSYKNKHINKRNGSLRYLVEQGGILLNASLTVEAHKPNSHESYWRDFTAKLIEYISEKNPNLVYILLGKFALELGENHIKKYKDVCCAAHPVAFGGFLGSGVFVEANETISPKVEWCNEEYWLKKKIVKKSIREKFFQ